MSDNKGKVKEAVGYVTGDRHVEAEGVAEQKHAKHAEGKPPPNEVKRAEDEVRRKHGDISD